MYVCMYHSTIVPGFPRDEIVASGRHLPSDISHLASRISHLASGISHLAAEACGALIFEDPVRRSGLKLLEPLQYVLTN